MTTETSVATENFDSYADASNLGSAANWDEVEGNTTLMRVLKPAADGKVRAPFASDIYACCRWVGTGTWTADQYAKGILTGFGTAGDTSEQGVALRISADTQPNQDFYFASASESVVQASRATVIGKYVNGTKTELSRVTGDGWAGGDEIKLWAVGDSLTVFRNGVSLRSVTDAALAGSSSTPAGVSGNRGTLLLDTWEGGNLTADPPVAAFSGTPLSGTAPLTVTFTDLSTNTPTSWAWDFGDTGTSTSQNPSHQYVAAGSYTVTLTATNAGGSDPETKINYITVTAPPVVVPATTAPPRGNAGALLASWEKLLPKRRKDHLARDRGKYQVYITIKELSDRVAARHLDSDDDAMVADLLNEFDKNFMEWTKADIEAALDERDRLRAIREEERRKELEGRAAWLERRGKQTRNKKL